MKIKKSIIHPDSDKSAEENEEMYLKPLPFAKANGVKSASSRSFNYANSSMI